ncbi:MAG: hypothetical protein PHC66_04945 [Candidatus Nanoarchaeia archaeon]|nr:hypothetical protein [Candidatus Nanoarchaeia archaeon]MDD5238901.1 hypothetical protein [Candidatus Nanoarchaeia archaeon]
MRIAVESRRENSIAETLKRLGHKVTGWNPELVVAFGGDGTFLRAERIYPNVPKLFIYSSETCKSCCVNDVENILQKIPGLKFREEMKLDAVIHGKRISALNEINVHYNPPRALRFDVRINGKLMAENAIGDGVVVATPFGASAYFHSITGRRFTKGIGIAFNNLTKKMRAIIAKENSEIEIIVKRENGIVAWDDSLKTIPIKEGDIIRIHKGAPVKVCLFKKA